ncbi:FG-GAP-like repeat-containing protein [Pedobacter sp. KR3-3]|uniref:FG-GAP-like repeat-containing protein n=1 Tax=Pedobacter albus TaxID=3113905 RepID=A0ABU7I907_9SPHI|nr:FG-GAP-like repeat-containing protein [Pedobacter sp. KR3-3]MEE1945940.1 FG-GAP-like repeat-containing protein [Pedobacter sp. KR3-3]
MSLKRVLEFVIAICCVLFFTITTNAQIPKIISFSPLSGPIGTVVTIQGQNFNTVATGNIVYFGGMRATVTGATSNSLTVIVPAGITNKPITVLNETSGLMGQSAKAFGLTFNEPSKNSFSGKSFTENKLSINSDAFGGYVELADLDNDGKLDLGTVVRFGQKVIIYQNTGATGPNASTNFTYVNTFYVTPTYLTHTPRQLRFADLNGDGKLDMIVPYLDQNFLAVYRNTSTPGKISFATEVKITAGPGGIAEIADLNNDGKPEILTAKGYLINNSTRTNFSFSAVSHASLTYSSVESVQATDFDEDGRTDILVSTGYGFSIFKNTSSGIGQFSFEESKVYPYTSSDGHSKAVAGDINNDGKVDVVMYGNYTKNISISENNTQSGTISFAPAITITTNSYTKDATVTDINGDSKPELIVATDYGHQVYPNQSTKSIALGTALYLPNEFGSPDNEASLAIGDINGDGKLDILSFTDYNAIFFSNNILGLPEISSFSPTAAKTGDKLTITGKNFKAGATVKIGNLMATDVVVVSPTTITALVSPRSGNGAVEVTTADGTVNLNGFTYIAPPQPAISSITPNSAAVNATVVISGTNFKDITAVRFGGINAKSFVVNSTTMITAVLGPGGIGDVTLETPEWTSTFQGFNYLPLPTLTNPFWSGAKGQTIRLTGTNLQTTNRVTLGGLDAESFKVISPEIVDVVVGDGETGQVVVTTAYGKATSGNSNFEFIAKPPKITSVSSMTANVGVAIKITGENFSRLPLNNSVYFGGAKAIVKSCTTTELMVNVPAGATYDLISVSVNKFICYSKKPFVTTGNGKQQVTAESFGDKLSIFVGNKARHILAADFEPDGRMDIAVALASWTGNPLIQRNIGTNNDIAFASYEVLTNTKGEDRTPIALALNNNGRMGLSVLNLESAVSPYVISFDNNLLYNGPEKYYFSKRQAYTAGEYSQNYNSIAVGDVLGNSTPAIIVGGSTTLYNVLLCDVDGDGKPDIVERRTNNRFDIQKIVAIYRNISGQDANGTYLQKFADPVLINVEGIPIDVTYGDFDNDGKLDLAVNCVNASGVDGITQLLKNTSSPGTISMSTDLKFDITALGKVAAYDINGDGKVDLAVSNNQKLSIYLNNGSSVFGFDPKIDVNLPAQKGIVICDFNSDGFPDLAGLDADQINILKFKSTVPTVASFTPTVATEGNTVTITGANLDNVSSVSFGGIPVKSFTIVSSTKIVAELGVSASGDMVVNTPSGAIKLPGFIYIPKPVIATDGPTIFPIGGSLKLSTQTGNNFNYQWIKDEVPIPGATTNEYLATLSGSYTVMVTLGLESVSSAPVSILNQAPAISANGPTSFSMGNSVTLSVPTGSNMNYQWFKNGAAINNATNSSFMATTSGDYTVVMISNGQELKTNAVKVNVILPSITLSGPLSFNQGGNVTLGINVTAPTGSKIGYTWFKDGKTISGATSNSYTATESGSYYVEVDINGNKFKMQAVNVTVIAITNLKLAVTNISCRGSANGSIAVTATTSLNYTISITDENNKKTSAKFSTSYGMKDLNPGTYAVCIGLEDDPLFKQCFTVLITEPKELKVFSTVSQDLKTVQLDLSGAEKYIITLNNERYETSANTITLNLLQGINHIKVASNITCQTAVEKTINVDHSLKLYPNPVSDILYIDLIDRDATTVQIEVLSLNGAVLINKTFRLGEGSIPLQLSSLSSGMYLVKVKMNTGKISSHKILKK